MDFEIALLIMNQIIPNAIMWYTGEAGDSDFDPEVMFGESDDEDDEEDGDGNDDQDDDERGEKKGKSVNFQHSL